MLRKIVWHCSSSQPTLQLDDEELLLELPLLRLGTDGATAIEVGGDIVRSAAGAPGKSSEAGRPRPLPRDDQAQLWHWQLFCSCLLWAGLQGLERHDQETPQVQHFQG